MKFTITLLLAISIFTNLHARRGIPIPVCFPCEEIHTVIELPEADDFKGDGGEKLNLGYMYEEYGAIWIPVWNSEGQYILTNEKEDTYYDLSEEELNSLKESYELEIPSGNPLSIWKKIGGKVIFGLLALLIIWGQFSGDDDE